MEKNFQKGVGSKLCNELVYEKIHESRKLKQVDAVPEVFDVFEEAILSELNDFEEEQEHLSDQATDVA